MSEEDTSFNPVELIKEPDTQECVEKLLKSYMKESTRISKDGAIAASEYLRLFVIGRNLLIFES